MFHFAWVDPADTSFDGAYSREDEQVLAFEVEHREGECATLSVEIRNPRVGLLTPLRKVWAWLSQDGTPLFFGRLVGAPDALQGETITLHFVARPADFADQKETVAATLRVLPFFDPVWVAPEARNDPDAVLEARSALWHIDRVSHVVTASDIVAGEATLVDIDAGFYRESLGLSYAQTPARRVIVEASVSWEQRAKGSLDISKQIIDAFAVAGTEQIGAISSYTGEGLMRDWPYQGAEIGAGWSVGRVRLQRLDGTVYPATGHRAALLGSARAWFPLWVIKPVMRVSYDCTRSRRERVTFELAAETQPLLSTSGEEDVIRLSYQSSAVGEAIDGVLPIGDLRRRSYVQTDRGEQSLQHLILIARAQLVARARAVQVQADIPFATAITLSCRGPARLSDARLPGGEATGKIVGYRFGMSGDTGEKLGSVVIACTIGTGADLTGAAAGLSYVEAGYANAGWQSLAGGDVELPTGDVAYEAEVVSLVDDGVDFFSFRADQAVQACTVTGGQTAQEAALDVTAEDAGAASAALNAVATQVALTLIPLDELSFETTYALTLADLVLPKTIDLEAA